jgi:hypothetical protein
MRLLLLAFAVAISGSAFAAQPVQTRDMPVLDPTAGSPKSCPPTSRYEAARRGARLGMRNLDELPAADLYRAVYRRIGGCNAPIIVRYNVGGAGETSSGRR